MISIKLAIVENAIKLFENDIEAQRSQAYNNLTKLNNTKSCITEQEYSYLEKVIKLFESANLNIITAKPPFLEKTKNEIGKAPTVSIKNKILECLDYEGLRSTFYPKYFQQIGIKACVYCNSQLTVSVETSKNLKTKSKKNIKAKFQLDHYHNKADYPFLSISLYNLYPVCASCNQAKGQQPNVSFNLYSEIVEPSKYQFKLDDGCVTQYLLNHNAEDIRFQFIDPDKSKEGSFHDTFDIEGIYNTQKDIIEEIIIKSQIYNDAYKQKLTNSFPELFAEYGLSNRIFLGNYIEEENIHKRPMAKFTQDIAKQLGLI